MCRTNYNDVQNVMGALFICITFLGTSNSNGVQPIVAVERPVYYRELAAGECCDAKTGEVVFAQLITLNN